MMKRPQVLTTYYFFLIKTYTFLSLLITPPHVRTVVRRDAGVRRSSTAPSLDGVDLV